jgi:TolB-like protein/tetratricopeptide (TPR) repeat protein
MSPRRVRTEASDIDEERHSTAGWSTPGHALEPFVAPATDAAKPRWRCLLSSIAVAVSPLRNLTGDTNQNRVVKAFTDDLVSDLLRHGRGFSLQRLADNAEPPSNATESTGPKVKYVVSGSAQRGRAGMLRLNIRITDAATSEYLRARRYEFRTEELAPVQTKIIRRISRELHVLLLQQEIRRASTGSEVAPELNECLSSAAIALEGELRPDNTAEAQRWYLAALADDPRNVEALVGLARTCQELVSNPWWGDPAAAAVASDVGREVVALALDLAPGAANAHCIQGMLYSAAGRLENAAHAFERALAMDRGLASAHGFAGYNAVFLGRAGGTLPAIERAMGLDRADRRHSIWFFFGGFAELLVGRTEASITLLEKSLERNRNYGSAQLFLMAALSLSGRPVEAAAAAASFRQQYPDCPATAFERLWLARSASATYRAQILPVFERIRELGAAAT